MRAQDECAVPSLLFGRGRKHASFVPMLPWREMPSWLHLVLRQWFRRWQLVFVRGVVTSDLVGSKHELSVWLTLGDGEVARDHLWPTTAACSVWPLWLLCRLLTSVRLVIQEHWMDMGRQHVSFELKLRCCRRDWVWRLECRRTKVCIGCVLSASQVCLSV